LAAAQTSAEDCDRRWLESATYAANPARWLQIGRYLGSLSRVSDELLSNRINKSALTRGIATVLIQAGRSGCALSSEHNVQLLQNVLLTNRSFFFARSKPPKAPFYLLSLLLSPAPFGLHYLPDNLRNLISSFKDAEISEIEQQYQAQFPFVKQAYELSVELSHSYAEAATPTQRLGVLETILEKCRNAWGFSSAIVAAQIGCVSQRRVKTSTTPFDFFASKLTTTQRLRGAKARGAHCDWWLRSLETSKAQTKSLRMLLIEGLLLLCSTDTITNCEAPLSEIMDSMPDDEWNTLAETVSSLLMDLVRRAASKEETTALDMLSLKSERFAYLIALREPERFARSVFLKRFRDYSGMIPRYVEFRQIQALKSASANELGWDEALAIIRAQTH